MERSWIVAYMAFAVLFILATVPSAAVGSDSLASLDDLRLGLLLLGSSRAGYNSSPRALNDTVRSALQSTAEELANYTLVVSEVVDTKCDRIRALDGLLDHECVRANQCWPSQEGKATLVAVLGGGCVTDAELIAETVGQWQLPLISFTPYLFESPSYDVSPHNKVSHFQMYPSQTGVVTALISTLRYYGWTRITIISELTFPFIQMEKEISTAAFAGNITNLQNSHIKTSEDPRTVGNLTVNDTRVIFLNMYEDKAAEVLCYAFSKNMFHPQFTWIVYGWYSNDWWTRARVSCNATEMAMVTDRAIVLQQYPISPGGSQVSVSSGEFPYLEPLVNDAVHLLVRALNQSLSYLARNDSSPGICPESTQCGGPQLGCVLRHMLLQDTFEGESGTVQFESDGTRFQERVRLLQFRNGSNSHHFASIVLDSGEFLYSDGENNASVWPDGIPPDGSPITTISIYSSFTVALIFTLSILGMVLALACLGFSILFRERKIIKLTSPRLNFFMIGGTLLLYTGTLLAVIPTDSLLAWDWICPILPICLTFGYTLCMGTVVVKMWRIHQIFHNPSISKKQWKDWHLALMIVGMCGVAFVLLLLGLSVPLTRPQAILAPDGEHPPIINEDGIEENFLVINCFSSGAFIWQLFLYLYLGLLQASALILAVRTRKVKISVLKETKELTIIVCVCTFVSLETIIFGFLLQDYNNIQEIFFNTGLIIVTTTFLILLYVPKMILLYFDPKGETIMITTYHNNSAVAHPLNKPCTAEAQRIRQLEEKLNTLRSEAQHNNSNNVDTGVPRSRNNSIDLVLETTPPKD